MLYWVLLKVGMGTGKWEMGNGKHDVTILVHNCPPRPLDYSWSKVAAECEKLKSVVLDVGNLQLLVVEMDRNHCLESRAYWM